MNSYCIVENIGKLRPFEGEKLSEWPNTGYCIFCKFTKDSINLREKTMAMCQQFINFYPTSVFCHMVNDGSHS